MLSKRDLFSRLARPELEDMADRYGLELREQALKLEIVDLLDSTEIDVQDVLSLVSRDRLKKLCRAFGLDPSGRKPELVERLHRAMTANDSAPPSSGDRDSEFRVEDSADPDDDDDDDTDDEDEDDGDGDDDESDADDEEEVDSEPPSDSGAELRHRYDTRTSDAPPGIYEAYECESGTSIVEEEPEDRPYQVEALRELDNAFARYKRVALSLPTGAGKTFVAAKWLADNLRGRALWLTHRIELVHQAVAELQRVLGRSRRVSIWTSAEKDESGSVIVATVGCQNIPNGPFEILIVDEAHHRAAPSYKEWAKRYRFQRELGLTATPERHDQAALGYEVIVKRSFWELVEQRYLAAPIHHVVETHERYELRKDRIRDDFEEASLRQLDNPARNRVIVQQYLQNRAQYQKTLIFAVNVEHAGHLVDLFSRSAPGVRTASILGTTDHGERARIVQDFERGRLDVLINCKVFVEGFNCKDIQTIFLTRPTLSAVLYCQMVGRGSRVVGDKRTFHLVEFADQLSTFADKLAGFWSLGDDNQEVVRRARQAARHSPADAPLLLSPQQSADWSTNSHRICGVLAYWLSTPVALQGATLVHKSDLASLQAAIGQNGEVDHIKFEGALRAGHWPPEEQNKLLELSRSGFSFHLYDFGNLLPPPTGAPAAVASIQSTAEDLAPFVRVEEFIGTANVDWGSSPADWRNEFLAQRQQLGGVARITDDLTGRVTPQKISLLEVESVRAALKDVRDLAAGSSGERLYSLQQQLYAKHLKGTSITEYKWFCLAKSAFKGEPTFLDLRS